MIVARTRADRTASWQTPAAEPVARSSPFPSPTLDDTAAYQGYQTRFYRDSKQQHASRSTSSRAARRVAGLGPMPPTRALGFTVRDAAGSPARSPGPATKRR